MLSPRKRRGHDGRRFKEMVICAAEVDPATLPRLYERALMLGIARSANRVVGVGAIKKPFPTHRRSVFRSAQSKLSPEIFTYELGWFHVLPEFQGNHISSRLVQKLIPWLKDELAYATSRSDNRRMHCALITHGKFEPEGCPYPSRRGSEDLKLFVQH